MKKFISIVALVALLLSITPTSFAKTAESNSLSHSNIETIENGNIFTLQTNTKEIAILTDNPNHIIDISIKYVDLPNIVYQWTFYDYPSPVFSPEDHDFWYGIIEHAENNIEDASLVQFTTVTYEDPIELPQVRSSAGADLTEDLIELHGAEYFGTLKHLQFYQNQVFRVFETLDYRILTDGSKSWSTEITVSSLIVGVIGLAYASVTTIGVICTIYGLVASASSLVPPGSMNFYICRVMNYRYITINGSEYVYNFADKYIDYKGYEDANLNSTARAYVDTSTATTAYAQSESYFNSYTAQIEDAYDEFIMIGQMD